MFTMISKAPAEGEAGHLVREVLQVRGREEVADERSTAAGFRELVAHHERQALLQQPAREQRAACIVT
jgi:hypothetical protein